MSNYKPEKERAEQKFRVLLAAAKLFLEKGYSGSSTREIAGKAGINVSAMNRLFGAKENILCELVDFVLEGQFRATKQFLGGEAEALILFYAAETTLQLYMAEQSESIRDLYAAAYSIPSSAELIRRTIAQKLEFLFRRQIPLLHQAAFYELEIATGSIIRSYMLVPCTENFSIERKVRRFLEASLRVFRVPEEEIQKAVEFVGQFDYPRLAEKTIRELMSSLEDMAANKEVAI